MPRYEVLSEESMAVLEEGWRTIVRDIGIEFQWEPALVAVFLFNFLYCWNDLFAPLLYLGANPDSYTVSLGLSEFRSSRHVDYELMMAACVLFTLPVTMLFFLAQRAFVEGVTVTGVKG